MPEQIQEQEKEKKQLVGFLKLLAIKLARILHKLEGHLDKTIGETNEEGGNN